MMIQQKISFHKKLALLIGATFLLSSAQAGKFDDVDVIALNDAADCTQCVLCPADEDIGNCGEKFVVNSLLNKNIPTYLAQHDASHGIDVVAFIEDLIILHESKMSTVARITPAEFKKRLGNPRSGRQQSRTWLNDALEKMKNSQDSHISNLGKKIEKRIDNGTYFVRTGNLRVDTTQGSRLQFYAMQDRESEIYELEASTYCVNGPFGKRTWTNQHAQGFTPLGNELPLTNNNINWLNWLFQ